MATIVLSAVGAAAGASVGGGVLGLSSMVIGRALGATLGRAVDQRLMGSGSEVVDTTRVDRFRLSSAGEGASIAQVYGRMRVAGQVIWASRFRERVNKTTSGGGGKGAPAQPRVTVREFSYSVSLAIALCEGEISRVGRVWADGEEIARDDLTLRVYTGGQTQMPDPKIEAVEGAGTVPAYRGTAYVVIEDLDLGRFGNRVPQFNFEVVRPAQDDAAADVTDLSKSVQAVAMIPGTGEYALATKPVYFKYGTGKHTAANLNSPSGKTDFETSLETLNEELPNCGSISLVVSWFGDDLRCDRASLRPKVEQSTVDGKGMAWKVSGLTRATAQNVPQLDSRPVYGGTPTDQSVKQAIEAMNALGKAVVFYPFILMDQLAGNGLADPWSGGPDQPALPWRGRMTLSVAPGQAGSPDQTALAETEVADFFGTAQVSDFAISGNTVSYNGPAEWSYRRFILHYAHLCAAAGGVDAFCIGSEMRGLTQIRGSGNVFPAVLQLKQLAADVRAVLGAGAKIGYAADWTEYFGYQPQDGTGDLFFHLDPLWSDSNIDFVGIDNYMPMSDWRDGQDHADASWGSIYNIDYLQANIEGGEGYDWYYLNSAAEARQDRSAISDGAYGEPWVYRYKDIRNWWSNTHHDRVGGVRAGVPSEWVPQSKPIWFMEIGCAAIDKGTNEPNKFLDLKSSESALPKYSDGRRDDLMQMQYLRALLGYWGDPAINPVSTEYGGPMVDVSRAHVWAWDARPYPFFPHRSEKWSDAENYYRGHWLNGRSTARSLADVVAEICARSGVGDVDVAGLYGLLRGYAVGHLDSARAAVQPLMLAYGFDAIERDGKLIFRNRDGLADAVVDEQSVAWLAEQATPIELTRAPEAETTGRLRLNFVDADGDYDVRTEEAVFPDETSSTVSQSDIALSLTRTEGRAIAERWLAESRVARDAIQFSLPKSQIATGAGDIVHWAGANGAGLFRIDRVVQGDAQLLEATRVEPGVYSPSDAADFPAELRPFSVPVPVSSVFMDIPLLQGTEVPHAPHLAVTADPFPGSVAVFSSDDDSNYGLNTLIQQASIIGVTENPLAAARAGMVDRGAPLRIALASGDLASTTLDAVQNGANVAAIGDGSSGNWEIFQFTDATLVAPGVYEISGRLRGQAGTDALATLDWPTGSTFVLLDGAAQQIALSEASRGLARHYRIGPAQRPVDDPSYEHFHEAFEGIGLRPYAPVHLRSLPTTGGDLEITWVRRTRVDGDTWQSVEVPLGEEYESYVVRVVQGGSILREASSLSPAWTYTAAMQSADGLAGLFEIEVAQMSSRFGPGLFRRIEVNV